MNPRALVQPLEARWQAVLDTVLQKHGRSLATGDVARLAPKVVELSHAYNTAAAEGRRTKLPLEARIAFSFPRDVPKGAGAVRELIASGALTLPEGRPLRVLDLGAGLGAMTWGLVRALAASGAKGRVEALLVDEDPEILREATSIARAAQSTLDPIDLSITTRTQSVTSAAVGGDPYDVVILGQVLSELDPRAEPEARVKSQADLVAHVLDTLVATDGALVIVEPALRERTRHLHAVRDRVLEAGRANVFAPCLHSAPCPALTVETEWCHEDLPVDLPPWVVPLARAAGLRWQGLTFSYLVLRKDGRIPGARVCERGDPTSIRFRVVSDLRPTKGKVELFICTEEGHRPRIRRLDRDAGNEPGASLLDLQRGDIVTLSSSDPSATKDMDDASLRGAAEVHSQGFGGGAPIDERGRVAAKAHVAIDVGAVRN